jgi:hypothetical protein
LAELGEIAGLALDAGEHDEDVCPFCREAESGAKKSDDVADLEEDPAVLIGNDSGKLDKNMGKAGDPRPADWIIAHPRDGGRHPVVPNPHHLIPGNESLKKAATLLPWIFAGETIDSDAGYDVNHAANGVWLPSNNAMRGDPAWRDAAFKRAYVRAAMEVSGGHFHDRHGSPYSAFVTGVLNKIADRLSVEAARCPRCAGEGAKPPPYGLVERLDGVSRRLAGALHKGEPPDDDLYTSKLVPQHWWQKGGGEPPEKKVKKEKT